MPHKEQINILAKLRGKQMAYYYYYNKEHLSEEEIYEVKANICVLSNALSNLLKNN